MFEWIAQLFDTADFPARWNCGNWTAAHGWTHIVSDVAIFGAYAAIPVALGFLILRRGGDVPFLPIFWLFAAFILACGLGHLVEATIFWNPWYRFSGAVKVFTAVVSWLTVAALVPVLPKALALPGLAAVNKRLEKEVTDRTEAERKLQEYADELQQANEDLQRHNEVLTGREYRVIALKKEINGLLGELGREPRFGSVTD